MTCDLVFYRRTHQTFGLCLGGPLKWSWKSSRAWSVVSLDTLEQNLKSLDLSVYLTRLEKLLVSFCPMCKGLKDDKHTE